MKLFSRPLVAAKVIITGPDGRILTVRRSKTAPRRPLTWDFPGGLIEPGETMGEAVVRETLEEAGILISTPQPYAREQVYGLDVQLFAASTDNTDVTLSYEHDMYQWVTPAEFELLEAPRFFKIAIRKFTSS